jgi:hypothetical protein
MTLSGAGAGLLTLLQLAHCGVNVTDVRFEVLGFRV